jgi:hypothetical protein
MPCPLFNPTVPLGGFAPDAAPLGDLYAGECAAAPETPITLDIIRHYCNFGYARKACARAAHVEADAARFIIRSHSGGTVEVGWATESNHHPLAVGSLSITLSIAMAQASGGESIDRQARACVSSWLRRTGKL